MLVPWLEILQTLTGAGAAGFLLYSIGTDLNDARDAARARGMNPNRPIRQAIANAFLAANAVIIGNWRIVALACICIVLLASLTIIITRAKRG
jgi:hypothetical protein